MSGDKSETTSNDWTFRQFVHTGDEYFARTLSMIREARSDVIVETYIYSQDKVTEMILEELGNARRRGCRVRVLADAIGSFASSDYLLKRGRELDLEVRIFNPPPRSFTSLLGTLWRSGQRPLNLLRLWNRRDHRKVTLVDETTALLGSFNLSEVHSEKVMGDQAWRDSAVVLRGPSTQDLSNAFTLAWRHARPGAWRKLLTIRLRRPKFRYDPKTSAVRLHQGRKLRRWLMRDLIGRLNASQKQVLIVSAYFLPTRGLVKALIRASKRGVDVRIIVPGPSDVPVVRWAAAGLISLLLRSGVRVLEFQHRILHAKYHLIDDWAALGSLNLNHRSVFHDLEVEAAFSDRDSVTALEKQWFLDARASKPVRDPLGPGVPWWKRLVQNLAFRMRYVM